MITIIPEEERIILGADMNGHVDKMADVMKMFMVDMVIGRHTWRV